MRRYRQWAGNPKGNPEDPKLCIAVVPEGGMSPLFRQCGNRRGRGPDGEFCWRHAQALEQGRYVHLPYTEEETK